MNTCRNLYIFMHRARMAVALFLCFLPTLASAQSRLVASTPGDILDAIRVIPMSERFISPYVNAVATFSDPAFRDELLTPGDEVEVLKDVPNGFVALAKHWNPERKDPEHLEFALFRGNHGRCVVVGSYYLDHPDGYWSRVEAYLWENGSWREATNDILPTIDLRNYYPARKQPAGIFQKIVVQYLLPRKGTGIVAIPHDEDETDPSQEIREGLETWANQHPNGTSDQNRNGYFKAYRQAIRQAPIKKLSLTFDREKCRFSVP